MKFLARAGRAIAAAVVLAALAACTPQPGQDAGSVTASQSAGHFDYSVAWGRDDCLNSYTGASSAVVTSAPGGLCRILSADDPFMMQLYLRSKSPDDWYITLARHNPAVLEWSFRSDGLWHRCTLPDCADTTVLVPGGYRPADDIGEWLRLPRAEVAGRQAVQLQAQLEELKAENQALYENYKAVGAKLPELSGAEKAELQAHYDDMGGMQQAINGLIDRTLAARDQANSGTPATDATALLAEGRLRLLPVVDATVCTAAYSGC